MQATLSSTWKTPRGVFQLAVFLLLTYLIYEFGISPFAFVQALRPPFDSLSILFSIYIVCALFVEIVIWLGIFWLFIWIKKETWVVNNNLLTITRRMILPVTFSQKPTITNIDLRNIRTVQIEKVAQSNILTHGGFLMNYFTPAYKAVFIGNDGNIAFRFGFPSGVEYREGKAFVENLDNSLKSLR